MTFRRRLEAFERALEARIRAIPCSVHLCLGQLDVPEVLHEALRPQDWLFSTHRSHGHYLAKGGDPDRLLAEIDGRADGINGGFSGSQSYADPALRFHSTAIVGGLVGVAAGAAMAARLRGLDEIVVCCIGDAVPEQGIFWESLNFAALHRLPILYVCENNGLSVHAPLQARQARPIDKRAAAFGLACWHGVDDLRRALDPAAHRYLPGYAEVPCVRECRHVSAMEDLRE